MDEELSTTEGKATPNNPGVPEFSREEIPSLVSAITKCDSSSFRDLSYDIYAQLMRDTADESEALKNLGEPFSYGVNIGWNRKGVRAVLGETTSGWPPALGRLPKGTSSLWADLYDQLTHPAIKARFADLLLSANHQPTRSWAIRAVKTALPALQSDWDAADRHEMTMRAISIIRQFNLDSLRTAFVTAVLNEIEGRLDENDFLKVSLLQLARAIHLDLESSPNDIKANTRWESLHDRLWKKLEQAEIGDYAIPEIHALARTEAERASTYERHVRHELRLGNISDEGFPKLHHFEKAAQLARKYELKDLHNEAIRSMQSVPKDALAWEKVGTSTAIPRGLIEREARKVLFPEDWRKSLLSLLCLPAPTGDHERNLKRARKSAASSIRHHFTNVTIGVHGLPEKTGSGQEDAVIRELALSETIQVQMHGTVFVHALGLFESEFPEISTADIVNFLISNLRFSEQNAQAFADGLTAFWGGDLQYVLTASQFHIERVLREFVVFLNLPVYRVQSGEGRGRFPSMEMYLEALDSAGFDENWNRSIRSILLSEGWNLRNRVAHGHLFTVGPIEAGQILRILGFTSLISSDGASTPDTHPQFSNRAKRVQMSALRQTRRVLSKHRRRKGLK